MTPDQIAEMESIFTHSRKNFNKHLESVAGLPFRFNTHVDLKKFEEAEKIMGEMSLASVALLAWFEACPHLDEFENPVQALIGGLMIVDKKFKAIEQMKEEPCSKIIT
jgi:hypothetical protein